jgi:hypothetical protein
MKNISAIREEVSDWQTLRQRIADTLELPGWRTGAYDPNWARNPFPGAKSLIAIDHAFQALRSGCPACHPYGAGTILNWAEMSSVAHPLGRNEEYQSGNGHTVVA